MAEPLPQRGCGQRIFPQQGLKLEQQIIVIQQALVAAVGIVGIAQPGQAIGVGQQVKGLAPQHFVQRQFLVAGLAQQPHNALGFGKRPVALAQLELILAVLDRLVDVGGIHDCKRPVAKPVGLPAPERPKAKGVKGAALHARKPLIEQQPRAVQHFLRSLAGKGEQEHGVRFHAVLCQPCQTVDDGAGFAAACACHNQHRAVAAGGCLVLGFVKGLSVINHVRRVA